MDDKALFFEKMKEMTGKTQKEIEMIYLNSKKEKHSEIRTLFINDLGLTYGFANTLAHYIAKTDGVSLSEGKSINQILDELYSGEKEKLRPIHDIFMNRLKKLGDFEVIPKKNYISLKHKKQFVMIGPKTNTRIEIGINGKDIVGDNRLEKQPKGSMCQYIVKVTQIQDLDDQFYQWIQQAYAQAS